LAAEALMATENGWEPSHAGPDILEWRTVPGTNPPVRLQVMKGWPSAVMIAYAADYNAYIEPLRDADSASFTPTNSVATSNHLNGTAMDLNWNDHPFRVNYAGYDDAKIQRMRDLLAFYNFEGVQVMFWAQDWNSPKDAMHHQMGYNTWNNPTVDRFIKARIRPDGFSTYKRGAAPPPQNNAADVLARATGVTPAKANEILPGVVNGLRDSQCDNVNRIAMWLAQIGHESAGFNATEEYQNGDESTDRWKYKGRTWIQITWRTNYEGLSKWAFGKGLIPSPTYFVDNPRKLADIQYAGLGPAWYWTVARPQINSLCDRRDLVAVTQAINGGQNGAPDRANRYERALALGDQLLALTTPLTGDDELSAEAERKIDVIYQELTKKFVSRSPLRMPGEGPLDTLAGFELYTNASTDIQIVRYAAGLGHPPTLNRLRAVANLDPNQYPDRADDAKLAQAILADIEASQNQPVEGRAVTVAAPADNTRELADAYAEIARLRQETAQLQSATSFPAAVTLESTPANLPATGTTGEQIGRAYDALEQLRLADALPIESRAPLAALIAVLQTKNGSEIK
jgi:predicted chitinase